MFNIQSTLTQTGTPGTLTSSQLYANPNVPRNSQAAGIQGTDGRGYTRTVGSGQLVENRLNRLVGDPNSTYINQARSEAQLQAASRGLGNSSIAGGAGVRAAIQSALPIASQDAQTMDQAQAQNQEALNANLMQERDIMNRMLLGNRQLDMEASSQAAQLAAAEQDRQMRLLMQRENLAYEGEQAGLGRAHDLNRMASEYGLRDQFGNSELSRELTRMGADYNWRNQFSNAELARDLDRMGADYGFRDAMADNDAARQDWLGNQNFNRQFYGDIMSSMLGMQMGSAMDFFSNLNNFAMNNPDVFNSEDYTKFSDFVTQNMGNVVSQIFSNMFGQGGPRPPTGG